MFTRVSANLDSQQDDRCLLYGMSTPITPEQVRHVAKLARLHLSEDQVERFTDQLGSILDYVDQLSQVDVTDVEPMAHPLEMPNVLREDEPTQPIDREQALANAPERDEAFFKVPKILDGGGSS